MKTEGFEKSGIDYIGNHEWILYDGEHAVIGISSQRLSQIKIIKSIEYYRLYGGKKKGEVLANIKYDRSLFTIYMPFDGKIISINDINNLTGKAIQEHIEETYWWIAKLKPNAAPSHH